MISERKGGREGGREGGEKEEGQHVVIMVLEREWNFDIEFCVHNTCICMCVCVCVCGVVLS